LQRREALIGVFDRILELLILLLQVVLLFEQGVIIADLPEHARIGADCGYNRYSADDSQSHEQLQRVHGDGDPADASAVV
jgi:hypothetical protein